MCHLVIITRISDILKDTAICLLNNSQEQLTDRNSILHINLILYYDVDEETNWTETPPPQKRIKLTKTSHKQLHMKNRICYQNDVT